MILGGPKDTIPSLWTKGLKALVPSNSFGPPTMVGVVVDFKDRDTESGSNQLLCILYFRGVRYTHYSSGVFQKLRQKPLERVFS